MKRVVVAIIAIAVAMGLSGCSSDAYDRIEELEEQCAGLEERLDTIYNLADEGICLAIDAGDGMTYAWYIVSGQEPYDEYTCADATRDIEDAQEDVEDLEYLLRHIRSVTVNGW